MSNYLLKTQTLSKIIIHYYICFLYFEVVFYFANIVILYTCYITILNWIAIFILHTFII